MRSHQRVRQLRLKYNYTQSYCAEILGVSVRTFIKIESGKRNLKLTEIKALADLFAVDMNFFWDPSEDQLLDFQHAQNHLLEDTGETRMNWLIEKIVIFEKEIANIRHTVDLMKNNNEKNEEPEAI